MARDDAVKLAAAQRPAVDWTVVAGRAPAPSAPGTGGDPPAQFFVLRNRPALSRADITSAHAGIDQRGHPDIDLEFTPHGARAFHRLTAVLGQRGAALSGPGLTLNQHLAAVVDGKLVTVVYVDFRRYPFGIPTENEIQITGSFTAPAAQQLAAEIAAPALPAFLELIDSARFTRHGG